MRILVSFRSFEASRLDEQAVHDESDDEECSERDDPGETVSAHEVKTDPTLSQALHLLNGETVQNKVRSGGVVARLLEAGTSPEDVIKKLYVRTLCREPDPQALDKLLKRVAEEENPAQTLEDLFWALLNSREFLFNH